MNIPQKSNAECTYLKIKSKIMSEIEISLATTTTTRRKKNNMNMKNEILGNKLFPNQTSMEQSHQLGI